MAKISLSLGKSDRTCADCTKCCEGWLGVNIAGQELSPGTGCKFVDPGVGCTIYDNRPEDICRTFECSWRATDYVPLHFSPKNTGQIIAVQDLEGVPYLAMAFAGKEVEPDFLSWFVTFAVGRQLNIEWSINGQLYALGSPSFMEARVRREEAFEKQRKLKEAGL
jgi:hypothetical protein